MWKTWLSGGKPGSSVISGQSRLLLGHVGPGHTRDWMRFIYISIEGRNQKYDPIIHRNIVGPGHTRDSLTWPLLRKISIEPSLNTVCHTISLTLSSHCKSLVARLSCKGTWYPRPGYAQNSFQSFLQHPAKIGQVTSKCKLGQDLHYQIVKKFGTRANWDIWLISI